MSYSLNKISVKERQDYSSNALFLRLMTPQFLRVYAQNFKSSATFALTSFPARSFLGF